MLGQTIRTALFAAATIVAGASAWAGDAMVIDAKAVFTGEKDGVEIWRFDVTVEHADTGWDHYANAFEVLGPDGEVIGVRTLYHPHVNEQPFTRSLTGVEIPKGLERVSIRAKDSAHEYGDQLFELELIRPE